MRQDQHARMCFTQFCDIGCAELFVHFAFAVPGDDLDVRHRRDVAGKIFVRDHDDPIDAPLLGGRRHEARGVPGPRRPDL